jgi:hypothetical protein
MLCFACAGLAGWISACQGARDLPAGARISALSSARPHTTSKRAKLENRFAYIPPQCFTQVADGPALRVQNPCYVCHADAPEPNYASQPEVQLAYDFPQAHAGRDPRNAWTNAFRDLRPAIARISDDEIRAYVERDNYQAAGGSNAIAARLVRPLAAWDIDADGQWGGYTPDAYFSFDAQGFDRAPDGTPTGYRAFAYFPLPGAFMPSNGSFDDVLIRLPALFRKDAEEREDYAVYALNLAVVEAMIRRADVPIPATDERKLGADLDGDGALGEARAVHYFYRPRERESTHYVGAAQLEQQRGRLPLAPGLFPPGTEFLHSVRYLAVGPDGRVHAAPRMKELRYARKNRWLTYAELSDRAQREAKEAALNPDRPEMFLGDAERGLFNALGWVYQGFIEDARGELRPQTHEETLACMGCHGGLSATEDGTFAFARKLQSGPAFGWHPPKWDSRAPVPDPLRADGLPEFATYLKLNPEGDGYRSNDEVRRRFFDPAGQPRRAAFEALARDVNLLLLPSSERALQLNKAYRVLVQEQSFSRGRDAVLAPRATLLRDLPPGAPTWIEHAEPAPRLLPAAAEIVSSL